LGARRREREAEEEDTAREEKQTGVMGQAHMFR